MTPRADFQCDTCGEVDELELKDLPETLPCYCKPRCEGRMLRLWTAVGIRVQGGESPSRGPA